jgi:hypothetical protein
VGIDRPLDPAERFFWLADGVSSLNFAVFAEVDGAIEARALRAALDRAQAAQPLLAVRIATPGGVPCFATDDGARIPLVERPASDGDWQAQIERELGTPFDPGVAPLARCACLVLGGGLRSVVVLTFHHAIADGRSGALLLRRVLAEALSLPAPPSCEHAACPPLHALFPPAFRWDEHAEAAEAVYEQQMALLARDGPVPPLPWLKGGPATARPRFERIAVERDATGQLLQRCRDQGTTLHGALGAAQLFALWRLWGTDRPRTLLLSHPVDLRVRLDRAVPPDYLGLYVSVLASPHRLGADTDFWALAREITDDLRAQLARGEAHLFYALQNLDEVPAGEAGVAWFGKRLRTMLPNVSLSNIGPVEAIDGGGRVRSIAFALCPMPFQLAFCAASTYAGRLLINLTYDAAKLPPQDAAAFAAALHGRLAIASGSSPAPPPTARGR